jgi:hypothetical protein
MWPDQSRDHIRGLYDEVAATLRQEMAEAEARGYRRAIDELLKVPSHETHVAADWLEAQRDGREPEFGHTDCAELDSMLKATQQMVVRSDRAVIDAEAKLDRLSQAATRVVQLVTHGTDGLVVGGAVAEMRRVLDGGGQ